MANGDAAQAAGMDIVPPNSPSAGGPGKVRMGYDQINKTRDYIVQFFNAAKAYTDTKFASVSLTWGAITGKPTHFASRSDIVGRPGVSGSVEDGLNAAFGLAADALPKSGGTVTGPLVNPYARNNGVSGWLALGVNPSGQFGFQMSSRRFKKDIASWSPDKQAILAMRLVQFRYKVAFDVTGGELDQGLIAEELHDLGLTWLVVYDGDGLPVTVRYDRIGLALLAVVQDHEARLAALEGS